MLPKTTEFPPGFPYSNQIYSAENIEVPIVKETNQFFIEGKAPKMINVLQKKLPQKFVQDSFNQSHTSIKHKSPLLRHTKKFTYNTFELKGPENRSQDYKSLKEPTRGKSPNNQRSAKNTRGVSVPHKSTLNSTQGWTNNFTVPKKKLISSKQETNKRIEQKLCEEKLDVRDYLLDGSQFNTFSLPITVNSKESTKDQEIEEIIEVDEKLFEGDLYQDSLAPTPLMSMVPEANLFSKASKDICVKEVSKEDLEDSKLDDQIEMLGANNPSLQDYASRLRPFSPPFAQMNEKKIKSTKKEIKNTYEKKKTVVYDPILKCYYDPKNNEYYHVN
jgi:hypothetical protein